MLYHVCIHPHIVCTRILPLSEISLRAFWSYSWFILSCCICDLFCSVFSVYVHLMYIFLSPFSVHGFYCAILLDIVLFCCCTPDNDVDSSSPDMEPHSWYQSYLVQNLWPGVMQ